MQTCNCQLLGMGKSGPNLKSFWANQTNLSQESLPVSGVAHGKVKHGNTRDTIRQAPTLHQATLEEWVTAAAFPTIEGQQRLSAQDCVLLPTRRYPPQEVQVY